MLTTAPYLRTRRPSPTTAEFIVSTQPPPTVTLRFAFAAIYLIRSVLALGVLLLLYSAWAQSPYSTPTGTPVQTPATTFPSGQNAAAPGPGSAPTDSNAVPLLSVAFIEQILQTILRSHIGSVLSSLSSSLPTWVLIPSSLASLYLLSQRIHVEERLLVLRGLGIQTSSSGATIFSALKTRFIPTDKITDVLINEAFHGFEVRHYLAVIVDDEEQVVVVFPKLIPRPRILEKVWRGVRECLYEHGAAAGEVGNENGYAKGTAEYKTEDDDRV
ncbi:GPI-GlcNAc transferase complex, PIG-H component-domain-containing protein [Hypomontagnella monticulosa]|nr:GPI-GlcNAc transferase complex, PIG-H component-domain-containing protein [Hypomontagnella monticulosa]